MQVRDERGGVAVAAALGVRVLDTQDKAPARMARQQQVKERGPGITQMQFPGGTWGKTGHTGSLLALRYTCARLHECMLRETHESQQSAARRATAIKSAAGMSC